MSSLKKLEVSIISEETKSKFTKLLVMSKSEFYDLSSDNEINKMQSRTNKLSNNNFKIPFPTNSLNNIHTSSNKNSFKEKLNSNNLNNSFNKNNNLSLREYSNEKISEKGSEMTSINNSSIKLTRPKYTFEKDEFDDSFDSGSEDASAFDSGNQSLSDDGSDKLKLGDSNANFGIKSRRRQESNIQFDFDPLESNRPNKQKKAKELTEEDIIRKNDLNIQRKAQLKQKQEDEKKMAIQRILNDEGKKLRERQKKLHETRIKKEKEAEDKFKASLNKIKLKYKKDGKMYVRFPNAYIYSQFFDNSNEIKEKANIQNYQCQNNDCKGKRKYKDPQSNLFYCSVSCFKAIRSRYIENREKI